MFTVWLSSQSCVKEDKDAFEHARHGTVSTSMPALVLMEQGFLRDIANGTH